MSNVNHCCLQAVMERSNLTTHCNAEFSVEVRKRLVEQEYFWRTNDCTSYSNTLTLTTRECLRFAVEVLCEVEHFCSFFDLALNFDFWLFANFETECHVVKYGHVWVKSVVLEYHCDIAVFWRNVVHELAVDKKLTVSDVFKTSNHAESC